MVSVIIPTYNCMNYIFQAVNSVLKQSYKNVQIIVINDGSTDETAKILNPIMKNINYIRQENKGVSAARNTGIDIARGEFIAFLDADDMWKRMKLEIQIKFLHRFPEISGVFGDFSITNMDGNIIEDSGIMKHYPIFIKYKKTLEEIFSHQDKMTIKISNQDSEDIITTYYGNIFKTLYYGNFIKTSSFIIRKSAINKIGYFNNKYLTQEDYEYWLRLAKSHLIGYMDFPLTLWRKHSTQLTRKEQNIYTIKKSLEVIEGMSNEAETKLGKENVRKRLSEKNRNLGIAYLGAIEKTKARAKFKKSIKNNILNYESILFYLWSFMPTKSAAKILNCYRQLFKL